MQVSQDTTSAFRIFEFQGEFEHVELFNGVFDAGTLRMYFDGFYLQGRVVPKKMTLVEKERSAEGAVLHVAAHVHEVVLFDSPPRYILS